MGLHIMHILYLLSYPSVGIQNKSSSMHVWLKKQVACKNCIEGGNGEMNESQQHDILGGFEFALLSKFSNLVSSKTKNEKKIWEVLF